MTHTLTDAQSLTIADALTHTLTAAERRRRHIYSKIACICHTVFE